MREGAPSSTSLIVSFARGLGIDDRVLDPLATRLLPPWLARLADAPHQMGGAGRWYRRAVRATTFGLVDHMVLRTQAIDAHLLRALKSGIDQLVILGAGLDARAWRVSELRPATVYEVDHPSTQLYKQQRIEGWTAPTDIRYVPVDFERERFSERLEEAGFRASDRSIWIWEGVAMYLPQQAVQSTIAQLMPLAAPQSELVMTYRVPGGLPFGAFGRTAIPAFFAAAGEPLKATLEPADIVSAMAPEWEVLYDENAEGWQKLTGSSAYPSRSFIAERLAVARRRA